MSSIEALKETVARLRGPQECPWDRAQTHASLAECLIEKCCEVLDAIDGGDNEHMREELGDLLMQVVMHAQIAQEQGTFDLETIIADVNAKLIHIQTGCSDG